jgi:NDP-sugar pyrophosphorylase family protein
MKTVSKAFILAGGVGTRLRPFTYEIPKPMLPVKGRPILEYNIRNLIEHGVNEIVLGIGYKGDLIKEYFGDGSTFGIKIRYSKESKPLGTAGALKKAERYFKDTFFMCNGDEIKDVNYSKMLALHTRKQAIGTLALKKLNNIEQFGVVEMKGNKIMRFVEKPKPGTTKSKTVSAGAYVLEPDVLRIIPKNKKFSIERQVFPALAEQQKLYGCLAVGQWFPTDTFERYEKAIKRTNFYKRWFRA